MKKFFITKSNLSHELIVLNYLIHTLDKTFSGGKLDGELERETKNKLLFWIKIIK